MSDTPKIAGRFASQSEADLAAVRDKLAETEARLEAIAGKVPHASLRHVLGNPEPGDDEILAEQASLEQQLDRLRQALGAAEAADALRQAGAQYSADAARQRALGQHLGRIHKSAMRFSAAATNMNAALVDMLDAARSAFATLPPAMQRTNSGPISPSYLSRIARAEIARHDAANPLDARLFDRAPWAEDLKRGGGKWVSLADLVADHVGKLKDMAAKLAVQNPAEPKPEAPIVSPPELDLSIDLRGVDLGVEKRFDEPGAADLLQAIPGSEPEEEAA